MELAVLSWTYSRA